MGETALTVIAERGIGHLGSMTSAERNVLVTLVIAVSAGGVCMPPFYIFQRVKFHEHSLASEVHEIHEKTCTGTVDLGQP